MASSRPDARSSGRHNRLVFPGDHLRQGDPLVVPEKALHPSFTYSIDTVYFHPRFPDQQVIGNEFATVNVFALQLNDHHVAGIHRTEHKFHQRPVPVDRFTLLGKDPGFVDNMAVRGQLNGHEPKPEIQGILESIVHPYAGRIGLAGIQSARVEGGKVADVLFLTDQRSWRAEERTPHTRIKCIEMDESMRIGKQEATPFE